MAKPGDAYQEIVGAVQRALDPGSRVEVGVWVEGPDGRRDMDVAVRGTNEGRPHLTLIECKDWRVPVGIGVIDSLDSKRRDLDAAAAVVFSNSRFTEDAERKAARIGISLAAALRSGDPTVRVQIWKEFIARSRSVDHWSIVVFPNNGENLNDSYSPYGVTFDSKPVVNWLRSESRTLLMQATSESGKFEVIAKYGLRPGAVFKIGSESVVLKAFAVKLECSDGFARQTVREDVSLGSYDFLTGRVIVPDQQTYMLGLFDNSAWETCLIAPDDRELEPSTFRIDVTLLRFVQPILGAEAPELEDVIVNRAVTVRELA